MQIIFTRELGLNIILGLVILMPGIIGARRGIYRGILTLVGTLFGVVLVDLWRPAWATSITDFFQADRQDVALWLVVVLTFLAVVVVLGYGSGVLVAAEALPNRRSAGDRILGGLLGLLHGMMVMGYLLHYSVEVPPTPELAPGILAVSGARGLIDWLRWFELAAVVCTGLLIAWRLSNELIQSRTTADQGAPSAVAPHLPIKPGKPQPASRPAPPAPARKETQPATGSKPPTKR